MDLLIAVKVMRLLSPETAKVNILTWPQSGKGPTVTQNENSEVVTKPGQQLPYGK